MRFPSLGRTPSLALALGLALTACGDDDAPVPPPVVDAGPDLAVARCTADIDCGDGIFCNGRERCAPAAAGADSHGCVAGPAACGADPCDEAAATCPLGCPDLDADGVTSADCGGTDCDDSDAARYPGNPEVCDAAGVDDDCNPATLGVDADADTFVSSACCNMTPGGLACGADCDDTQGGVNPGSPEACNGIDDDCDTSVDERTDGSSMLIGCYADVDGDGFPDGAVLPVTACACGSGLTTTEVTTATIDCDDTDSARHPGAAEVCNFKDDDCDGMVDDGVPRPTDTFTTRPEAFRMRMSGSAMANFATPREAWLTYEIRTNDRGAAWVETPMYLGYGRLRIVARARAIASPAAPSGGWAVVIARGDPVGTDLGPAGEALGVPTDRIGLAIEWHFAGDGPDTITVVRIGPSGNTILAGPVTVADSAMQLESTDTISVTQRLVIDYTPDDLATLPREERLVIRTDLTAPSALIDITPASSFLGYELSAGELMQIGFTASNGATGPTRVYVAADDSSDETTIERAALCPP